MDSLRLFFEGAAGDWDSHQPPNRMELLERALAPFDPYFSACESILEVGTGTGALLPVLSRRYPAARLCSIDLARAMLCQAQKRPGAGAVAQCDVHALPFRNRAFSAVICHNSFPHFDDKLRALGELQRVLTPGGRLLIVHTIGRERLNAIHQNAHAAVLHSHVLPAGAELAELMGASGFRPELIEDEGDHYAVLGSA